MRTSSGSRSPSRSTRASRCRSRARSTFRGLRGTFGFLPPRFCTIVSTRRRATGRSTTRSRSLWACARSFRRGTSRSTCSRSRSRRALLRATRACASRPSSPRSRRTCSARCSTRPGCRQAWSTWSSAPGRRAERHLLRTPECPRSRSPARRLSVRSLPRPPRGTPRKSRSSSGAKTPTLSLQTRICPKPCPPLCAPRLRTKARSASAARGSLSRPRSSTSL
eukprot:Amastigsp_a339490_9.p3 type:complete len:222 gc:universal Amastigsp_a339490_9:1224-559(-)